MSLEIENKLIELIAKHAEVEPNALSGQALIKETGIDSIGIAELMFDIEEHYDITLDNAEQLQDRFELGSISDLAIKLEQKIEYGVELKV